MAKEITARALMDAGLSRSFAHHVMAGSRKVGIPLALWLLDRHGLAVSPIAGKSKAELRFLRSIYEPKAPKSVERRLEPANDAAFEDPEDRQRAA